jgi:hypothetical protein
MRIFVSGATKTFERHWGHPCFGKLFVPAEWGRPNKVESARIPWAFDNGAFGGWTEVRQSAFIRMIARQATQPHAYCKFVASPDVVGDSATTYEMWKEWMPMIRKCGLPVAYVLQDGPDYTPWDQLDALFIGGTTEFKLSHTVDKACARARNFQKWVHVGRVNTRCRLRHFHDIGVDSVDGTFWSKWSDIAFAKALKWMRQLKEQPPLPFDLEAA